MSNAKETCVHHWMIDSPNGAISRGTCKSCGSEREFYNTPEYMREGGNQWMRARDNWGAKQQAKASSKRVTKAVEI